MSVATSLRSFLIAIPSQPITQVAHRRIPEEYDPDDGFIWFARRGTAAARTFEQATEAASFGPDEQFWDIEIYHPDPDVVEAVANKLHGYDCYQGAFGAGKVAAMFVEDQSDDYVPQVDLTDKEDLASAFLSLETRSYFE